MNPEGNWLLNKMSRPDRDLLRPQLQSVSLETKQVLEAPFTSVDRVYFVTRGLASVVAATSTSHRIEVAMIGCEGMTGVAVLLGDSRSPNETMVQSAGAALSL